MSRLVRRLATLLASLVLLAAFSGAGMSAPQPAGKARPAPTGAARVKSPGTSTLRAKKVRKHRMTRAERQRRLEKLESAKTETGFRPRHALMVLLGVTVVGLLVRGRRGAGDGGERPVGARGLAHRPRAVVLRRKTNTDPLTHSLDEQTGVYSVPEDPAREQADSAAEIDRLTGNKLAAAPDRPPAAGVTAYMPGGIAAASVQPHPGPVDFRLATDEPADVRMRRGPGMLMPAALRPHFEPLPQEELAWSSPFRVPMVCSGMLAITNHRVLAVYERHAFRILPPGFETEVRRYEAALTAVTQHEIARTRRVSFLYAAAVLFLWYPLGTIFACLSLGLYAAMPRPELALWSGGVKRLYPLALLDADEARKQLSQAASKASQGKGGASPQQRAV